MGVESEADRLEFLSASGFGETATFKGQPFLIDFRYNEVEQEVAGMVALTRLPFGYARTSDLEALKVIERSQVTIRSRVFTVKPGGRLDDGTGMTRLEFAL